MKEKLLKEMLDNSRKGKSHFNDDAVDFITERINELVDIPLLTEEVERILIQAILRIIYNLLFNQNRLLLDS